MQITIDTRSDSPEDIKRAIKLLQSLIGEETTSSSVSSPGIFNMFDTSSTVAAQPQAKPTASMLLAEASANDPKNLEDKEEDSKSIPELALY